MKKTLTIFIVLFSATVFAQIDNKTVHFETVINTFLGKRYISETEEFIEIKKDVILLDPNYRDFGLKEPAKFRIKKRYKAYDINLMNNVYKVYSFYCQNQISNKYIISIYVNIHKGSNIEMVLFQEFLKEGVFFNENRFFVKNISLVKAF